MEPSQFSKFLNKKIEAVDLTPKQIAIIAGICLATHYALNHFAPAAVKKALT